MSDLKKPKKENETKQVIEIIKRVISEEANKKSVKSHEKCSIDPRLALVTSGRGFDASKRSRDVATPKKRMLGVTPSIFCKVDFCNLYGQEMPHRDASCLPLLFLLSCVCPSMPT